MAEKVNLTIDGVEIEADAGSMIIQAAMDNGLYIPYLCYYPGMKPYGACRMCVVKAESPGPDGSFRPLPGNPASCTTPISEGMKVETNTDDLIHLRKGVMELLISEHPHGCLNCHRIDLCGPSDVCLRHVSVNDRCVTCPKNERCELKDTVRYMEMELTTPLTYNNRHLPLDVKDPYWDMDMNLCIVCARCVRACDEVRGDKAITLKQKSGRSIIGTAQGTSLLESGCEFCGACIDVCPTGAIVERDYKWDKAEKQVTTTCPHCPVGCQLNLDINKRNKLVRSIPEREAPANQGMACFKGKFGLDFVNNKNRLKSPQIRKNGQLENVSWPEALNYTAERLSDFQQNGEYSVLVSPRSTNEDSFVAQKFARSVMNSNNVDISSNINADTEKTLKNMIGGRPQNLNWSLLNSKCIVVVGSNLTEEQNVLGVPIKQAISKGSKLLVIDQRETELTRYADIWIRPRVGTDATVIGAIIRTIVDESLEDHDFISNQCVNFDDLRGSLWDFDLNKVEQTTGISQDTIRQAARIIATSGPASFLYGLETLELTHQNNLVAAIINLCLITGNIDKPSAGIYPLFYGANERGAKDMGCTPTNSINKYNEKSDGIEFINIRDALASKRIKAIHLIGDSPNYHNGFHDDFIETLDSVEFLILQDSLNSDLLKIADVVLPSAAFSEKDGTYTNMEGRIQSVRQAMGPKGDEDEDWRILSQIAQRMGNSEFDYTNSESIFHEIKDTIPNYDGINLEKIPLGNQFTSFTSIAKFNFCSIELISETNASRNEEKYPLLLAPGRVLQDPDRDAEIETHEDMYRITRSEIVEINEQDAILIGASEGDLINITGKNFEFTGIAHVNGIHQGMVASTSLFGSLIESMSNSEYTDPVINLQSLVLSPVNVKKIAGSKKE